MLAPEEILFIQADWNYSELFISETLSELVTINLGKLEEMLPKGVFFRINRSIIINMNYLIRVNRKKRSLILMKDGKEFSFKVPLLNIRKIENYIDESSSI
jgi:two-component system LytT family response regulator